jgi:HTH-type transcriptional regulator / antitoxin HipB
MKTTTHEDLLNEMIGTKGTLERSEFDNELKAEVLAYKFKELRKKQHLTQTQLADKIGMGKEQISKIENGKFNLTLSTINKIASALGSTISFDLRPL